MIWSGNVCFRQQVPEPEKWVLKQSQPVGAWALRGGRGFAAALCGREGGSALARAERAVLRDFALRVLVLVLLCRGATQTPLARLSAWVPGVRRGRIRSKRTLRKGDKWPADVPAPQHGLRRAVRTGATGRRARGRRNPRIPLPSPPPSKRTFVMQDTRYDQ